MRNKIDPSCNKKLSTVFSSSFLELYRTNNYQAKLQELVEETGIGQFIADDASVKDVLQFIYKYLSKNYRFEYIYKNCIANQLLLKQHTLKSAVLFSEFRAGISQLDLLIVNGTTTAYEVKTELDSLTRLPIQLRSYTKMFDKTYVITNETFISKLEKILPDSVGLMVLNDKNKLITIKQAESNLLQLKHDAMFSSLRKGEYVSIVEKYFGKVPIMPNTRIYDYCLNLFENLSIIEAHNCFVKALHNRKINKEQQVLVKKVDASLKMLCLGKHFNGAECGILDTTFNKKTFKPHVLSLP